MDKKKIIIISSIIIIIITIIVLAIIFTKKNNNNNNNNIETSTSETSNNTESELANDNTESSKKEEDSIMYSTGKHKAKIEIENYGTIELELDADIAPISVANFAKLANEGFYNGLTFHRIIDGFMIQGGDPKGNGTGGSDENIKGEFSANGVKNTISHVRGTISMARSNSFNSASSQFFIVHEDSTFLDGQYAGFGKVTSGIEIVDKICKDTKVEDSNGTVLKANQPVITKVEMVN